MTERAPAASSAATAAGVTAAAERCATTGITKPECHCPACLAALVARHHRPGGGLRGA